MAKERFQITLNPVLVRYARSMMTPQGHDSLSEFLESLIREEAKRQNLVSGHVEPLHDGPAKVVGAPAGAIVPTSYRIKPAKRK